MDKNNLPDFNYKSVKISGRLGSVSESEKKCPEVLRLHSTDKHGIRSVQKSVFENADVASAEEIKSRFVSSALHQGPLSCQALLLPKSAVSLQYYADQVWKTIKLATSQEKSSYELLMAEKNTVFKLI